MLGSRLERRQRLSCCAAFSQVGPPLLLVCLLLGLSLRLNIGSVLLVFRLWAESLLLQTRLLRLWAGCLLLLLLLPSSQLDCCSNLSAKL